MSSATHTSSEASEGVFGGEPGASLGSIIFTLVRLAWPVALSRLGIMAMGLVDVVVVGQVVPSQLSHQALGWAPTNVAVVGGVGLLAGVQVLAARAHGAGERADAGIALRRGLILALATGGCSALLADLLGERIFAFFGIAPAMAKPATRVMRVLMLSVPLHLVYVTLAFFLEAIRRPLAPTWAMVFANGVNLLLTLWLVPRYGALGAAWSTFGARAFLAGGLGLWAILMEEAPHYGLRLRSARPRVRVRGHGPTYRALLHIGIAAGLSQAAESGAFSGMTILAGRLGERAVATYQIVLNVVAVVFMVALGISTATAVMVAGAEGKQKHQEAVRAGFLGLALNTLCVGIVALGLVLFATSVASAYSSDADLTMLTATLMPLAAAILLPDGGQVVAAGALRAQGDNWFPTASHVVAYALVMPTLAWWLTEARHQGVRGLLVAVLLVSILSVVVLVLRLWWISRTSLHARLHRINPP